MASRTPNDEHHPRRDAGTEDIINNNHVGGNSTRKDFDTLEGNDSDDDPDGHLKTAAGEIQDLPNKGNKNKDRNRKKKKKKQHGAPTIQTSPPTVLVSDIFPHGTFPLGEEVDYGNLVLHRTKDEMMEDAQVMTDEFLNDYRQAAETHRQVRQWAQGWIKPGHSLTEIANGIEDAVRRLVGHDGLATGDALKAGMGFPTGLNIDHVAAHFSPNAGCKQVLNQDNVLKVDIGVHVNGRIVDSAFTMAFDPTYDNLLQAVKDATNTGVREAGIDVRLGELGGYIQETMESYECEIDGTVHPIKCIRDLAGHTILPYSIHGTKSVPLVKTDDPTKMEEGDVFAIETFGTTGRGRVYNSGEVSHYALRADMMHCAVQQSSARSLMRTIQNNFGTLPWCRRYLDRLGQDRYLYSLKQLVQQDIVEEYPPLLEIKGSYTAQFEHTILLKPTAKEVISRGEDY